MNTRAGDDAELAVTTFYSGLDIAWDICQAAASIRRFTEESVLREQGLSWSGFIALSMLVKHQSMEIRHIALATGASKGTVSGVLSTLEDRGLVSRQRSARDGRLVNVTATESAVTLLRWLEGAVCQAQEHLLADFPEGSWSQVGAHMAHIVQAANDGWER
jgi:DNA-binding MarR family transcriptional regulator